MEGNSEVIMDEDTKWRVKLSQEIEHLVETMGPERQSFQLRRITFDPEHNDRGWTAVMYSGTMVGTGEEGVMLVPQRTLKILAALGIPWRIVKHLNNST